MKARSNGLRLAVALAPIIFTFHILEESTGYVAWFNAHVGNGITRGLFWRVNALSLLITLLVMSIELLEPSIFSAFVMWFASLMLGNAVSILLAQLLHAGSNNGSSFISPLLLVFTRPTFTTTTTYDTGGNYSLYDRFRSYVYLRIPSHL